MATGPQLTAAGNRFTQLGFLDENDGMFIGGTDTMPTAGTSTNGGMLFLPATKNANRVTPDPEFTQVTGEDGELMHQYDWTSNASRGFPFELSAEDLQHYGLIQNMPVTNWLSGQYTPDDISNVRIPNMMGVLQGRYKRLSDGVSRWGGVVILNGSVRVIGRSGFNERGAALFRLFITPQPSYYDMMGFSIVDSDGGAKAARGIPFNNLAHPVTFHAVKGNGVATQWTVDRSPISAGTVHATAERVAVSVSSVVTTSPYSITTAVIASGKRGILAYEFQE